MLNELLQVVFVTLLPYLELRGGIPLGVWVLHLDPLLVFTVSVLTNVLLVIPTFIILRFVFPFVEKVKLFQKALEKLRSKGNKVIEKYGFWGLMIFVAIPAPGTGAYSGSILAFILNMNKWKAFAAVVLGVLIAGIIVSIIVAGAWQGFQFFLARV